MISFLYPSLSTLLEKHKLVRNTNRFRCTLLIGRCCRVIRREGKEKISLMLLESLLLGAVVKMLTFTHVYMSGSMTMQLGVR